jgi:hypothetical protein
VIPPRYFPFATPEFALSVGARPFSPDDRRIEITPDYESELDQKARLLAADPRYYFQELPGTRDAQREAVTLLEQDRPPRSPRPSTLAPLDAFGRCVQEDLLLLDSQLRLVAGQLCFANAWCLDEKLGLPLTAVHAPVPGYAEQLATPVERLLTRLKPERPVWRVNWGLRPTPQLDQTSRHSLWVERLKQGCTLDNCWLRIERQTLSLLERTGHILFTIHTYQERVSELPPTQRELVAAVVRATPPDTLRYKGLAFLKDKAQT